MRLNSTETSRFHLRCLQQILVSRKKPKAGPGLPGVASPPLSSLPNIRSLALLYAASRSSRDSLSLSQYILVDVKNALQTTYFSFADSDLSFPSLPVSEVAFDGLGPVSPSPPLRMIFIAGIVGGGVLPDVGGLEMLVNEGGSLQNGVRKMRTAPATASTWCVI